MKNCSLCLPYELIGNILATKKRDICPSLAIFCASHLGMVDNTVVGHCLCWYVTDRRRQYSHCVVEVES